MGVTGQADSSEMASLAITVQAESSGTASLSGTGQAKSSEMAYFFGTGQAESSEVDTAASGGAGADSWNGAGPGPDPQTRVGSGADSWTGAGSGGVVEKCVAQTNRMAITITGSTEDMVTALGKPSALAETSSGSTKLEISPKCLWS